MQVGRAMPTIPGKVLPAIAPCNAHRAPPLAETRAGWAIPARWRWRVHAGRGRFPSTEARTDRRGFGHDQAGVARSRKPPSPRRPTASRARHASLRLRPLPARDAVDRDAGADEEDAAPTRRLMGRKKRAIRLFRVAPGPSSAHIPGVSLVWFGLLSLLVIERRARVSFPLKARSGAWCSRSGTQS